MFTREKEFIRAFLRQHARRACTRIRRIKRQGVKNSGSLGPHLALTFGLAIAKILSELGVFSFGSFSLDKQRK